MSDALGLTVFFLFFGTGFKGGFSSGITGRGVASTDAADSSAAKSNVICVNDFPI